MLKLLLTFLGFTTAIQAPPPRPPSARKHPQAAPAKPTEAAKPAPVRKPLVTRLPTLGEAVRAYAQSVGEFGSKPSAEFLRLSKEVCGPDYWAYLQALTLMGGRASTFSISIHRLGEPDAEKGLDLRLEKLVYGDLDFWDEVTKKDAARREAAVFAGRKPPESIAIPDKVLTALAKRMANRAAAARRNQRGSGSSTGGVKTTPETTDGQVTEAPAEVGQEVTEEETQDTPAAPK